MTKRKPAKTPRAEQLTQRGSSNDGLWVEFPNLAPEDCELVVLTYAFTYLEV